MPFPDTCFFSSYFSLRNMLMFWITETPYCLARHRKYTLFFVFLLLILAPASHSYVLLSLNCSVLLEGVKYYANEPNLLGKAFLRLERDFDKHVNYCSDEPLAQSFLETCLEAQDFFDVSTIKFASSYTIFTPVGMGFGVHKKWASLIWILRASQSVARVSLAKSVPDYFRRMRN